MPVPTPTARTCGRCASVSTDASAAYCPRCGELLPLATRASLVERGQDPLVPAPPPPAPRELPPGYVFRTFFLSNPMVLIGVIFTFPFFWTLVFPLIGAPILVIGVERAQRKLRALREGRSAEGTLMEIERDRELRVNGEHPWKIRYVFATPEGTVEGSCRAWDPAWRWREVGEIVQVVYIPGEAERCHALWPPVK